MPNELQILTRAKQIASYYLLQYKGLCQDLAQALDTAIKNCTILSDITQLLENEWLLTAYGEKDYPNPNIVSVYPDQFQWKRKFDEHYLQCITHVKFMLSPRTIIFSKDCVFKDDLIQFCKTNKIPYQKA